MRRIIILPCSSILGVVFCVCLCSTSSAQAPMSKPDCQETCGGITIPYPFGVGSSCSANSSFLVICRNDSTLFLPSINMRVMDISLQDNTITVKNPVTPMNCTKEKKTVPIGEQSVGSPFSITTCLRDKFSSPFDKQLVYASLVLDWEFTGAEISKYAVCNYVPDDNTHPYHNGCKWIFFPEEAKRCSCCNGFEGNPYFDEGCVDTDECRDSHHNPCTPGTCINEVGSYRCEYQHPNTSNTRVRDIMLITIGSVLGAGIFVPCLSRIIIKRLKARQRRKFFVSNGGLMLQQKLSSTDNEYKKSKLFGSEELAQATDHYNENRVLGRGGQGTVYKGMLTDGSIVAVKKSIKVEHQGDSEAFINEVMILSQIIHRNILRLLGCCLETQVPLLVYEFIPNGTLFQHIHEPSDDDIPLTWEMRLRIAIEVAGALAYLHSSTSSPIFHRDIKSTNILFDENYRAKVSDFGTSRSVAIDQSHFTTRVLGTYGYLDPEYFQSSQFTEKSDVYSFGVVMVELLTGEKVISSPRAEMGGRSLAMYFLRSMEEGKLFDIVDARIDLREGKRGEVAAVAELSRRCLHLNGKLRPTMRQVVNELESIQVNNSSSVSERNHEYHHYGVSDSVEPTTEQTYDCSSLLSLTLER